MKKIPDIQLILFILIKIVIFSQIEPQTIQKKNRCFLTARNLLDDRGSILSRKLIPSTI